LVINTIGTAGIVFEEPKDSGCHRKSVVIVVQ